MRRAVANCSRWTRISSPIDKSHRINDCLLRRNQGTWRHQKLVNINSARLFSSETNFKANELSAAANDNENVKEELTTREKRSKRAMRKHDFDLAPIEIAIIGRPNVGKSTLFNRLIRKKEAIVSNVAGTTRDRKEGKGHLGEIQFSLIDTGGFEDIVVGKKSPTELLAPEHGTTLVSSMHTQVKQAIENAHLVFFLVDAKAGLTNMDIDLAKWVRKNRGPGYFSAEDMAPIHKRLEDEYNVDQNWTKTGIVLVANKAEGRGVAFEWGNEDVAWSNFIEDCFKLGFGLPLPISAEHNQGLGELHNAMLPYAIARAKFDPPPSEVQKQDVTVGSTGGLSEEEQDQSPITITLIGRPNVGKSTLLNAIVGQERCITGPVPGLTRDAIQIDWEFAGRKMRLVDTAGIRRRTRLFGGTSSAAAANSGLRDSSVNATMARKNDAVLEDLSIQRSLRSLDKSQVVLVVVDAMAQQSDPDASGPLTKYDLSIMGRVLDEGRGLVVVANKCDLADSNWEIDFKGNIEEYVRYHIEDAIPMAKGVPIVTMSALESQNVSALLPVVIDTYDRWQSRISTRKLNLWLADAQARQPPPPTAGAIYRGKQTVSGPLRIKYMTQATSRPPTFVLFVNRFKPKADLIPEDYQRYLVNNIRSSFNLHGIPLRFSVKGSTNKERLRSPRARPAPMMTPRESMRAKGRKKRAS